MDKKTKFVFIVSMAVFIVAILVINALIKKYEKEPLTFVPQKAQETAPEKESQQKAEETQASGEEEEPAVPVGPGPLVN